jgi:hypothetical protein
MGVSYWEVGQRERAYELTEAGLRLVDQAVAEGLLAAETLTVPRGNLNAMGRALGKVQLSTPQSGGNRTQMAQRARVNANRTAAARAQSRNAGRPSANETSRRR